MPSAQAAMGFVDRVMDVSLMKATQELEHASTGLSVATSQLVRDAAMLGMCVGHVGLTLRISVVCSIKATQFAGSPCQHKGCPLPSCCGNRLEVMHSEEGGQAQGSGERFRMVVPHHKTASKGITMPTLDIKSSKLTELLHLWQSHGRPRVSAQLCVCVCVCAYAACEFVRVLTTTMCITRESGMLEWYILWL
jgi:hypothetical protein